jgi:hypothetical protein
MICAQLGQRGGIGSGLLEALLEALSSRIADTHRTLARRYTRRHYWAVDGKLRFGNQRPFVAKSGQHGPNSQYQILDSDVE